MVKDKTGDAWEVVSNTTSNFSPFKLVHSTTKNTWKLVSPVVKPSGGLLAKHILNVSGKTIQLAWDQTSKAWQVVTAPVGSAVSKMWQRTQNVLESYFPNTKKLIGEGIKNVSDSTQKAINHVRSRIDGFDLRPQF